MRSRGVVGVAFVDSGFDYGFDVGRFDGFADSDVSADMYSSDAGRRQHSAVADAVDERDQSQEEFLKEDLEGHNVAGAAGDSKD